MSSSAQPPSDPFAWLPSLLQLNDTFYPTGSYAHSFGLEGLAQEGIVRDRETLRAFVFASQLPALRHVELPLAAHAYRAFAAPDWKRLGEISLLSSALKSAREARSASEAIGRQRAELAATLKEHPLAQSYLAHARSEGWPFSAPVAAALEGRVLGAPVKAVLASVCYASLSATLAAAMKLLRLGQNGCQSLLTEALAEAPAAIAFALTVELEDIGWFNPWLDIAAARHETAEARLFIS